MNGLLDIVIVNWNSGLQLYECIDSVLKHGVESVNKIIVVDNGSTDGSVDTIEDFPVVKTVRTGKNLGFAAACNLGATMVSSPYILFLNPDTLVEANSFLVPLGFMERTENAHVGICGIQLVDEQGRVSRTCARFPTLGRLIAQALGLNKIPGLRHTGVHMKDWDHGQSAEVDHVIGAFFVIRRNLFESLGGFDESFFVYLEDIDLSFRARSIGFKSAYLVEVQAYHAGGGSSRQVKDMRLYYSVRSKIMYGFKRFPYWQAWLNTGVSVLIEPFSRIFYCFLRMNGKDIKNTLKGYFLVWTNLLKILTAVKFSMNLYKNNSPNGKFINNFIKLNS